MAARNVVLTDAQSEWINRRISSGRYQNGSEVLRAGLRLLEREEAELSELRARIETGLEQARTKDLAEGDGEYVIRRAFAAARARGRCPSRGLLVPDLKAQSNFARSRSTNF